MGIDLEKKRTPANRHREATTPNAYHNLLLSLYKFLARRTPSKFNQAVYRRLNNSRVQRYPMSLSKLVKIANNEEKRSKVLVVVGNVLNDERLLNIPKLTVCALRFSE